MRYFILASHYRSPLNYSDDSLEQAKSALARLYTALKDLPETAAPPNSDAAQRFFEAMDDDFNSPVAVSVLFDLAHELNKQRVRDVTLAASQGALLRRLGGILGILQRRPEEFFRSGAPADGLSNEAIETLIQQRLAARAAKNWSESDRIRDELKAQGVLLEDSKGGTTWRRQ